jgi:hypothetical protein
MYPLWDAKRWFNAGTMRGIIVEPQDAPLRQIERVGHLHAVIADTTWLVP